MKKLVIGCLKSNLSHNFYKRLGGKFIGNYLFREMIYERLLNVVR